MSNGLQDFRPLTQSKRSMHSGEPRKRTKMMRLRQPMIKIPAIALTPPSQGGVIVTRADAFGFASPWDAGGQSPR